MIDEILGVFIALINSYAYLECLASVIIISESIFLRHLLLKADVKGNIITYASSYLAYLPHLSFIFVKGAFVKQPERDSG